MRFTIRRAHHGPKDLECAIYVRHWHIGPLILWDNRLLRRR